MATEVELKLLVAPQWDIPLEELPPLKAVERLTFPLQNRYLDTPDQQLTQAGIALRLRHQKGEWLQTLKSQHSPKGGLHQRQEWEMAVAEEALEWDRLPADALPEGLDRSAVEVVFETNFERRLWLLDYQDATIELVLDQGAARMGDQESTIAEFELELKDGEPSALFGLATELARHIPLVPSDISKAERGFNLLNQHTGWPQTPDAEADTAAWLSAVCRQLEALPDSSADLVKSLQGLSRRGDGHVGLVQTLTAGLSDDVSHWWQLPDARQLGQWLIAESHRAWERDAA